jgi:hypothetical protein
VEAAARVLNTRSMAPRGAESACHEAQKKRTAFLPAGGALVRSVAAMVVKGKGVSHQGHVGTSELRTTRVGLVVLGGVLAYWSAPSRRRSLGAAVGSVGVNEYPGGRVRATAHYFSSSTYQRKCLSLSRTGSPDWLGYDCFLASAS